MIVKLREEVSYPKYQGMTDAEIVTALETPIEISVEYMLTDVRLAAAIGMAQTVVIVEALKGQGDPLSMWIVEKLATTGLDIGNHEAAVFIATLVGAGAVTQDQADTVLGLGKTTTTRAKQIGINTPIKDVFIEEARR